MNSFWRSLLLKNEVPHPEFIRGLKKGIWAYAISKGGEQVVGIRERLIGKVMEEIDRELKGIIAKVMRCQNGMVAVFDAQGEQLLYYQGLWDKKKDLILEDKPINVVVERL